MMKYRSEAFGTVMARAFKLDASICCFFSEVGVSTRSWEISLPTISGTTLSFRSGIGCGLSSVDEEVSSDATEVVGDDDSEDERS